MGQMKRTVWGSKRGFRMGGCAAVRRSDKYSSGANAMGVTDIDTSLEPRVERIEDQLASIHEMLADLLSGQQVPPPTSTLDNIICLARVQG